MNKMQECGKRWKSGRKFGKTWKAHVKKCMRAHLRTGTSRKAASGASQSESCPRRCARMVKNRKAAGDKTPANVIKKHCLAKCKSGGFSKPIAATVTNKQAVQAAPKRDVSSMCKRYCDHSPSVHDCARRCAKGVVGPGALVAKLTKHGGTRDESYRYLKHLAKRDKKAAGALKAVSKQSVVQAAAKAAPKVEVTASHWEALLRR